MGRSGGPGRGPPPAQAPPGQSRAAAAQDTSSQSEHALFSIRNHRRPARSTNRRARPRLEVLEDRTTPAQLVVNTLAGTFDHNDGQLSLREAIEAVNNDSLSQLSAAEQMQVVTAPDPLGTNDTIQIQVTGTIGLPAGYWGQLILSRDVTIQGPGSTFLTVSGERATRVFRIDA